MQAVKKSVEKAGEESYQFDANVASYSGGFNNHGKSAHLPLNEQLEHKNNWKCCSMSTSAL